MKHLLLYETFSKSGIPFDKGGYIVWQNDNVYITVNDINNATYICLFNNDNVRVGKLSLVSERYINDKTYRKVDLIDINIKYRNHGYGLLLYKVALKYLREDINGICSHLPDRSNKSQVPRIYKRLNSWNDGGDYEYIDRDLNDNIKIYEMAIYEFEFCITDWENQKKFIDPDDVKIIDDYMEYVFTVYRRMINSKHGSGRRQLTKEFNSSYGKLKTLIRQVKRNINVKFEIGQVFHLSDMYSFKYNTFHDTLKPESDWCVSVEDFGLGNILIYSDITIIDISPSGKSITIEFDGIDFRSHRYDRRIHRLKFTYNKIKIFYFNLLNNEEYQRVLSGEYMKKINENIKYNRNIQSQLDELLDKIGHSGFDGLSDEEKKFMKSFNKGKEKESYQELNKKVYEDGIFKFTLDRIDTKGDGKIFYGTLEINDMKFKGYINRMENGMNDPQFNDDKGLTLWDHADGYEYYIDDFIENIVIDNE